MNSPKQVFLKIFDTSTGETSKGSKEQADLLKLGVQDSQAGSIPGPKGRHLEILKKLQHFNHSNEKMRETVTRVIKDSLNSSGSLKQDVPRVVSLKDKYISQKNLEDGETTEKSQRRASDGKNMSRSSAAEHLVNGAQVQINIITNLIHEIRSRKLKNPAILNKHSKSMMEIQQVSSLEGAVLSDARDNRANEFTRGASKSLILKQKGQEENLQLDLGDQAAQYKPRSTSYIQVVEDAKYDPANRSKNSALGLSPGQSPREDDDDNFIDDLTQKKPSSKNSEQSGIRSKGSLQEIGEERIAHDPTQKSSTQEQLRNVFNKQNKQNLAYRKTQSQGEMHNNHEFSEMDPISNTVDYNKRDELTSLGDKLDSNRNIDSDRYRGDDGNEFQKNVESNQHYENRVPSNILIQSGNVIQSSNEPVGHQAYNRLVPQQGQYPNEGTNSPQQQVLQEKTLKLHDLLDPNLNGKIRGVPVDPPDKEFQNEIERQYHEYIRHYNATLSPNDIPHKIPFDQRANQNQGEEYEYSQESLDRKINEFRSAQALLSPHLESVDERHSGEEEDPPENHGGYEEPYELAYQNISPSSSEYHNRFRQLHSTLESVPEHTVRSETYSESPVDSPPSQKANYYSPKMVGFNIESLKGSHPSLKTKGSEEKRSLNQSANNPRYFDFDVGSLPVRADWDDDDSERLNTVNDSNMLSRDLLRNYHYNDSLWDSVQFYNVMDPESFIKPTKRIDRSFIKDLITPKRNPRIQSSSNANSNVEKFFRSRSKTAQRSMQSLSQLSASDRLRTDSVSAASLHNTSKSHLTPITSAKGSAQRSQQSAMRIHTDEAADGQKLSVENSGQKNGTPKSQGSASNRSSNSRVRGDPSMTPLGKRQGVHQTKVAAQINDVMNSLAYQTQERMKQRAQIQAEEQFVMQQAAQQQEQLQSHNNQQEDSENLADLLMTSKWFQQGSSRRKK